MSTPTLALVVGPGLLLEAVNKEWRDAFQQDAPLGQPIEETFPDPVWRSTIATIREVMRDGRERCVDVGGMSVRIMSDYSRLTGSPGVLVVAHPLPVPHGSDRSLADLQEAWAAN